MELRVVIVLIGALQVVFSQSQCGIQRKCVPFDACPEYRLYVGKPYRTWPSDVRNEVKAFHCGTEQGKSKPVIKICCKTKPVGPVVNTGRGVLDLENCGKQSTDRIAYGKIAKVFEFPWMALLGGLNGNFHCGGSLIAESFVLTAAHCNRQKIDFVRVGETDLSTPIDCNYAMGDSDCAEPYQDIKVAQFIRHPRYSAGKRKNDIALIKLQHPVRLNDNVQPICLPVPEKIPKQLPRNMTVSGWGFTEDQNEISNRLRFAHVPIVGLDQCQRSLRRLSDAYTVDDSQVCAGADSTLADNCEGDSGGPLQYFGNQGFVIHGVVSWGLATCGKESSPGVYTKVSQYVNWIVDNLK